MTSLIAISPVRNERSRFLKSWLDVWSEIADRILIADNGSTDGSRELCLSYEKCEDITPPTKADLPMFGRENIWRKYMYQTAMSISEDGDVLCWADTDMIPIEDPRPFFSIDGMEVWTSVLYDLWEKREDGTLLYRDDEWWRGHHNMRIWAARNCERVRDLGAEWNERAMHAQHIPISLIRNANDLNMMQGPTLLHYGWLGKDLREEKFKRYKALAQNGHLTEFEWAHAQTALDDDPNLEPLPKAPRWEMEQA